MATTKRSKKTIGAGAMTAPASPEQINPASQLKGMAIPAVRADGTLSTVPAAAPGWLAHVKSTVKGGVDVMLGACTAITSVKNRRGKTAVLDTVRLLIDGKHPVGAHSTKELSSNSTELAAVGEGASCSLYYEVPRGKNDGIHQMNLNGGQTPCIIESATELLKSTPTARAEFVSRFCSDVDVASPTGMTPDQAAKWNAAVDALTQEARASGQAVIQYVVANIVSYFNRQKLAAGKAAAALQGEITRSMESVATDVGSTEIVTEPQLAAARQQLNLAVAARALTAARERAPILEAEIEADMNTARALPAMPPEEPANLAELQAAIDAAAAEYTSAQDRLTALSGGPAKLVANLRQLHVDKGYASCLVCTKPLSPEDAKANAAAATTIIEATNAAIRAASNHVSDAQSKINSARNSLTMAKQQQRGVFEQSRSARQALVSSIQRKQGELKGIQSALANAAEAPAQSVEEAQAAIDKLHAARTRQLAAAQSQAGKSSLQQGQSDYSVLQAKSIAVVQQAIEAKAAAVLAAVQRYMPDGFKAELTLVDEKGEPVYRWGVIGADGRSHRAGAASGSEWGALLVAVACVWAEGQGGPRILLLDDADLSAFSGENLTVLLTNIAARVAEGVITQAIVTSLRAESIPASWHKVVLA